MVRRSGQKVEKSWKSTGINVSTKIVQWELNEMGFHSRAATFKPDITKTIGKPQMEGYKAHRHWTV